MHKTKLFINLQDLITKTMIYVALYKYKSTITQAITKLIVLTIDTNISYSTQKCLDTNGRTSYRDIVSHVFKKIK